MRFSVLSSKLTGKPDDLGWTQVYDFDPEDGVKREKLGHLFVLVSIGFEGKDSNEDVDGIFLGREIFARLCEEYYGQTERVISGNGEVGVLGLIRGAVSKTYKEFSEVGNLEVCAASLVGNIIYLVSAGGSGVFLLRETSFVPLIKGAGGDVKSASGFVEEKDRLLLVTGSFLERFSIEEIRSGLTLDTIGGFGESFMPFIQSGNATGCLGAFVLEFKDAAAGRDSWSINPKTSDEKIQDKSEEAKERVLTNSKFGIWQKFKNFGVGAKSNLYVEDVDGLSLSSRKRKMFASVGVVLVLVLLASIVFGIRQKNVLEKRKFYEEDLAFAKHKLGEAEDLQLLNPTRARELFLEGRERVLGMDFDDGDDKAGELRKMIEEARGRILGEYSVDSDVFLDLDLLSRGFNGDFMSLSGGDIFVADKNGRKIVRTSVDKKRAEVVAGPSKIDEIFGISSYFDNLYVANSKGVFNILDEKLRVSDEGWGGDVLTSSFASNLYVLEKSSSLIWRLSSDGNVFGKKTLWISEEDLTNLSDATSFSIDGDIWVLTGGGEVYKFSRGVRQNFSLREGSLLGFEPGFLYTDEDLDDLYFADKSKSEVLVFDKKGEYKAKYLLGDSGGLSWFVVSSGEKRLIYLKDSKLYSFDLKHF